MAKNEISFKYSWTQVSLKHIILVVLFIEIKFLDFAVGLIVK